MDSEPPPTQTSSILKRLGRNFSSRMRSPIADTTVVATPDHSIDTATESVVDLPEESALARMRRLIAEYDSKPRPTGWHMSDPRNHDPDNFQYIVHAINYDNDFVASLQEKPLRTFNQRAPQRDLAGFLSREAISSSAIDELHTRTYAQGLGICHGFILNVPDDAVIAVSAKDLGKAWDVPTAAQAQATRPEGFERRKEYQTGHEFLKDCPEQGYNEVLVNGTGDTSMIGGVYLVVDPFTGKPVYEDLARLTPEAEAEYTTYRSKGWTDEMLEDSRYAGPQKYRDEKFDVDKAQRRYQEAKDLAALLDIPLIPIPLSVSTMAYEMHDENTI